MRQGDIFRVYIIVFLYFFSCCCLVWSHAVVSGERSSTVSSAGEFFSANGKKGEKKNCHKIVDRRNVLLSYTRIYNIIWETGC